MDTVWLINSDFIGIWANLFANWIHFAILWVGTLTITVRPCYTTLLERGAVFNAPPVTLTDGELAGSRWAYLRDPDGIQLEIWASPE
jgi:hypothetical protein